MISIQSFDAVIVGSGPNGLSAAITLAEAGLEVAVIEAGDSVGGGMRSAELTLPGYVHDVCSAIHPLAYMSPFLGSLPLEEYGLRWIFPPAALAHPFDDGSAGILDNSVEATVGSVQEEYQSYYRIYGPLIKKWTDLLPQILGPLKIPRHLFAMTGFGLYAIQSAVGFVQRNFSSPKAQALFAGLAAHSMLTLDRKFTAGIALVLGLCGHVSGWPLPKGGTQNIANALKAYLEELGGKIFTGISIENVKELPDAKVFLFDLSPKHLLRICEEKFTSRYRNQLNKYRYGPGVFKIDWALRNPIPFTSPECRKAATVHVGGNWEEIAESESLVWRGIHPDKPFVILAQQSLFDGSRTPQDRHTAWAYCHVPSGSTVDMTERIENQIERFAPGFKDVILAKSVMNSRGFEEYNPNYVGGDINGGVQDWRQLFTRPAVRLNPYSTPDKKIYLCSSSTPPGGGVHGMCGFHAAQTAMNNIFKIKTKIRPQLNQ